MIVATSKLLSIGSASPARAALLDDLRQAGFELDHVEMFQVGLERLASAAYGLVILHGLDTDAKTYDLCAKFKQSFPKISFLLMLAAQVQDKRAAPSEILADGLLIEPTAPLELIALVRTLLRLNRCEAATASSKGGTMSSSGEESVEYLDAQLAALYTSSLDAIVTIDGDDIITSWSPVAEQLSGYTAEQIIGQKLPDIGGVDDTGTQRKQYLQRLRDGESVEYQTLRTRKDGDKIEVWIRGAPIKGRDGKSAGATFFIRDITAQKKREQHVHFLMRELTHRSKNLLAVIQAMARQSLSHLSSPEEFVARFSARLSGLAGSHDLLSNVDWEGASLVDLIKSQLRHYEDRFDEKIHIDGPDLFLRPEAAQNIGIALHELSTNAAKYGALSVPDGNVTITWRLNVEKDISRLWMTWHETGGPSVNPPNRKGFGHIVMDRITGQALGGTSHVEFNSDGVTWTLDVPAASVILEREKRA